jgi:hypothetical protein
MVRHAPCLEYRSSADFERVFHRRPRRARRVSVEPASFTKSPVVYRRTLDCVAARTAVGSAVIINLCIWHNAGFTLRPSVGRQRLSDRRPDCVREDSWLMVALTRSNDETSAGDEVTRLHPREISPAFAQRHARSRVFNINKRSSTSSACQYWHQRKMSPPFGLMH